MSKPYKIGLYGFPELINEDQFTLLGKCVWILILEIWKLR